FFLRNCIPPVRAPAALTSVGSALRTDFLPMPPRSAVRTLPNKRTTPARYGVPARAPAIAGLGGFNINDFQECYAIVKEVFASRKRKRSLPGAPTKKHRR